MIGPVATDATLRSAVAPRISRSEALALDIERRIGDHKLAAGTRIGTKSDLREQFGLSVGTVNEAVRLLEGRGLIEARPGPGGGIFVAAPSSLVRLGRVTIAVASGADAVASSLVVRNALESPICEDAARHRTKRDIRDLERCYRAVLDGPSSPLECLQRIWALHRRIAEISPNAILREIYLSLLDMAETRLEAVELKPDFDAEDSLARHRGLIDAIASGDVDQVRDAVRAHAVVSVADRAR
jgi:DNA-binding FadR family transcriptional regulator